MAVGSFTPFSGGQVPLVERWNGSRWSILSTPGFGGSANELNGVSCTSSTACIAVGDQTGESIAERWNGRRWSVQNVNFGDPRGAANKLTGVSCSSQRNCAAVGSDDVGLCANQCSSDYTVPVLGLWHPGRWSLKRDPNISCSTHGIEEGGDSLYGVSCTSATACMAVGTVVYRWNGRRWSIQNTHGNGFNDVSCTSSVSCTAVASGMAGQWNGTDRSIQNTPDVRAGDLTGVSCTSTGACIAVGSYTNGAGRTLPLAESMITSAAGVG